MSCAAAAMRTVATVTVATCFPHKFPTLKRVSWPELCRNRLSETDAIAERDIDKQDCLADMARYKLNNVGL